MLLGPTDEYQHPSAEKTREEIKDSGYLNDELLAQVGLFSDFLPEGFVPDQDNYSEKGASTVEQVYAPTSPGAQTFIGDPVDPPTSLPKRAKWEILAHGIPERSFGVASNSLPVLKRGREDKRNFNMQDMRDEGDTRKVEWPLERVNGDKYTKDWKHVDFRHMPINFVENTYEKMIELAENREE
jgi:hypothetical protein